MKIYRHKFQVMAAIIFTIIFSLSFSSLALGRTLIEHIEIVNVDYKQFPEISLNVNLLDGENRPITQLQPNSLVLAEDNINMPFTFQSTTRGLRVVLVIDEGNGLNNTGNSAATQIEEMKYVAKTFLTNMQNTDSIEVIIVRGEDAETTLVFTGNRDEIIEHINNWSLSKANAYSYGLIGASQAIDDLKKTYTSTEPRLVLFLSPGVQVNKQGYLYSDITEKAKSSAIPFYSVVFRDDSDVIKSISKATGGAYARYTSIGDLDSFFTTINSLRQQYIITYKTASRSVSERNVSLTTDPNSALASKDSISFNIDPQPQPPLISSVIVNNGDPIRRIENQKTTDMLNVLPTETQVIASIVWPDYPARKITENKLIVNGIEFTNGVIDEAGNLSYVWDLRSFTLPGTSTIQLQIAIKDELGFETIETKSVAIEVVVSEPGNPVCDTLGKIPKIGDSVSKTCYQMGIGPSQVLNTVLAIAALVLAILLWVNRKAVGNVGQQAGVAVTRMVERITQRHGSTKAKARLDIIAGGNEGQRTQFDVNGETPIGRDREYAELIFDNPTISRSHCKIHLDKSTGYWSIEDCDSANGTFLNDKKLEPFEQIDLKDGDTIELSPIERGGIKLRFTILSEHIEEKPQPQKPAHNDLEKTNEEDDVRLTFPVNRGRQTQRANERSPKKDNEVDPSNPEF